jgi:PAS domain-containing protein
MVFPEQPIIQVSRMDMKPTYKELEKKIQELEQAEFKRKRADRALRESEERFRLAFITSPDSINQKCTVA